jgi:Fe-S cluster assembly ATP-binding protein
MTNGDVITGTSTSLLVITHNPKVVEYLKPKYLHIFINGKIVKTGTKELINQLNTTGYNFFN